MRILVISNFYPPQAIGGYERGCHEVVRGLESRGHEVLVLTSRLGLEAPTDEGPVKRWLEHAPLSGDAHVQSRRALAAREISNQRAFDGACRELRPDVVSIWNMARVSMALAHRAAARGPVCYYVSDAWLAKWTEPGWYGDTWFCRNREATVSARLASRAAHAFFRAGGWTWPSEALRLQHVQFCSAFMKEATQHAGRPVDAAEVVHWGVDVQRFEPAGRSETGRDVRVLFVGQVLPHKGVHTAIEALGRLHREGHRNMTLTVVGASHEPGYQQRLERLVTAWGIGGAVRFAGAQPREAMPPIYAEHDVLVFPSCWDEPFAITPLEAMASGLAVVGTTAGGSGELFEHERNALTFPAEDADACAAQLLRVAADSTFRRTIACRGLATVRERFTLDRMVDRVEAALQRAATPTAKMSV